MTRREFLKFCLTFIASLLLRWQADAGEAGQKAQRAEAQAWSFPLAFPAYFAPNKDKRPHKQYFPLITNG